MDQLERNEIARVDQFGWRLISTKRASKLRQRGETVTWSTYHMSYIWDFEACKARRLARVLDAIATDWDIPVHMLTGHARSVVDDNEQ